MPINVIADDMSLDVDAVWVVSQLQGTLEGHWKGSLLSGRKASGGALPLNSKGKPLGVGNGTIATTWASGPIEGSRASARASSSPGQEGGLSYAVRAMTEQDANPASIEGKAGQLIDAIVSKAADKAIR